MIIQFREADIHRIWMFGIQLDMIYELLRFNPHGLPNDKLKETEDGKRQKFFIVWNSRVETFSEVPSTQKVDKRKGYIQDAFYFLENSNHAYDNFLSGLLLAW